MFLDNQIPTQWEDTIMSNNRLPLVSHHQKSINTFFCLGWNGLWVKIRNYHFIFRVWFKIRQFKSKQLHISSIWMCFQFLKFIWLSWRLTFLRYSFWHWLLIWLRCDKFYIALTIHRGLCNITLFDIKIIG